MISDILALYGRLLLVSTPLFVVIFFFTWWMRGRGFGEFVALFSRLRRAFIPWGRHHDGG